MLLPVSHAQPHETSGNLPRLQLHLRKRKNILNARVGFSALFSSKDSHLNLLKNQKTQAAFDAPFHHLSQIDWKTHK